MKIFLNEFIASFIFIFAWIVIRNHFKKGSTQWNDSLIQFINPLFLTLTYTGSQSIGAPFFNGYKNPNFAINTAVWTHQYYNYKTLPDDNNMQTFYDANFYGRYAWVYLVAPFAASILSGILAIMHVELLRKREPELRRYEKGLK